MKLVLTASTLFTIALTGFVGISLVSKASTLTAESLQRSGFAQIIPEDAQDLSHHDCYYDTYGNLHCW